MLREKLRIIISSIYISTFALAKVQSATVHMAKIVKKTPLPRLMGSSDLNQHPIVAGQKPSPCRLYLRWQEALTPCALSTRLVVQPWHMNQGHVQPV
jgi:hypothetical protein